MIANLLNRLTRTAETTTATSRPNGLQVRTPTPCDSATASHAIGAAFDSWVVLTDAYAEQFLRMQRGDKGAREKAIDLSHEMLRMKKTLACAA